VTGAQWSLAGRTAVVTGAGRGLGLGCAQALAEAGADVVLVARTESEVAAAAEAIRARGGSARAQVADVTHEQQVVELFAVTPEADVLVNSAGTNVAGPTAGYDMADYDAVFGVNVRATFLTCREFGQSLLRRGSPGAVVNLSSQMGTVGYPGRAVYCASKHAVEGLTKALAVEWAREGIRVNAVAPTFVRTPLTEPMFEDAAFAAEVRRRLPTGEIATVQQVADAVRYLACDAAGSVTGSILRVDGGWTAW
jgi:NAD(P)-dependent dehydrogenase (short-subunit alcohol dehydrogenase family)